MAMARAILDKLKTNEKAEEEFGWLRPGPFWTNDKLKTNEKTEGEFGWLRPRPFWTNRKRTKRQKENSDGYGPGHCGPQLKRTKTQKENSDGYGPSHFGQTDNERKGRRRIRMATARAILDKLKTNEKAEGEFGWLRPGPFWTS